MRPCDGVETAEAWQWAINKKDAPTVMALTRQGLPTLRTDATAENKTAKGAYILKENCEGTQPDIILMASGSEVSIAAEAYEKLANEGKKVRLVSVPCLDLFEDQDDAYKMEVLGDVGLPAKRIAVEAGIRQSWDRYLRPGDEFVGMNSFGESAPAEILYEHFGITADAIIKLAKA
jgi:transketolase